MSRLESFDEPLVSASAGNFGQGLAYAARKRGVRLTVFASEKANTFKVERMRALGAEVRLVGEDFDDAKEAPRLLCPPKAQTHLYPLSTEHRAPALRIRIHIDKEVYNALSPMPNSNPGRRLHEQG